MQLLFRVRQGLTVAAVFAAALGLAACSGQQASSGTGMLGYGTPSVSSYTGDDQAGGLQAELDKCRQVSQADAARQTRGLAAACSQLQRTVRNQPGNAVQ
jgi:hypothetical protein